MQEDVKAIISMERYRELLKKEIVANANKITIKLILPYSDMAIYFYIKDNDLDDTLKMFTNKLQVIVNEVLETLNTEREKFIIDISKAYPNYEDRVIKNHYISNITDIIVEKLNKLINLIKIKRLKKEL